ncbi:MAG: hypothetical protein WCP07_13240 [bacterium]
MPALFGDAFINRIRINRSAIGRPEEPVGEYADRKSRSDSN